jgi:hypothetical protein
MCGHEYLRPVSPNRSWACRPGEKGV